MLQKLLTLNLLLFCFSVLSAQEKVDMQMMQKIKDEEQNNSQIKLIAHNLTDVCGARLTNSPGYKRALDWVTQTLQLWGLKNAGREAWGEFGRGWSNEASYIAMKQPYYQQIIGYPVAWTTGTRKTITADVVMLDQLDSASINKMGSSLKGKIVMVKRKKTAIPDAFKPDASRYDAEGLDSIHDDYMMSRKEVEEILPQVLAEYHSKQYLQKKGAAALLTTSRLNRDGTVFTYGSPGYAKGYDATLPEMVLSAEDYNRLQRLLEDNKPVQLELNVQNKFYDNDLTGYNVVGEIPGTDSSLKDQVVIIGGHLDSWHSGTGATDDGAGCIAMLEAIRLLKALNVQPRRTIRIALWGGEEQGLYGSYGYVKKHYGDAKDMVLTPEQSLVTAYYNLDNGTGKIRGIYAQNNDKVMDIFQAWLAPFADMGATKVTAGNTGGTDHLSFDAVGIPGFQFIQDPIEYDTRTHHSNMDTYDHLSMEDLQQAATIIAAFVYNTAMRDDMMPRKPLPKPERFIFDTDVPF